MLHRKDRFNVRRSGRWALMAASFVYVGCGAGDSAPPAAGDQPDREERSAALPAQSDTADQPTIVFLGTSLTAGFGVDPDEAFPARVAQRLRESGLPYRVVNAGVSGETSAGAVRRIDWVLQQPHVRFLVLETGANDGLRGQDPDTLRGHLETILRRIGDRLPMDHILLVGMEALPNLGEVYTKRFRAVFPDVAHAHGTAFLPFLLEGVAGIDSLNQSDGIHPNARGHAIVAEAVWAVLEPMLRKEMAETAP